MVLWHTVGLGTLLARFVAGLNVARVANARVIMHLALLWELLAP